MIVGFRDCIQRSQCKELSFSETGPNDSQKATIQTMQRAAAIKTVSWDLWFDLLRVGTKSKRRRNAWDKIFNIRDAHPSKDGEPLEIKIRWSAQ